MEDNTQKINYTITGLIGSGSYGKVYKCKSKENDAVYAMKIVTLTSSNKRDYERETLMSNMLNDIGIKCPRVHDSFTINNNMTGEKFYYIIMDLIDGVNFQQKIDRDLGNITIDDAISIGIQLFDYLRKIHDKDIVLRDIKPDNVMIGENCVPYLVDFYLAEELKNIKRFRHAGTPYYMSPEIANVLIRKKYISNDILHKTSDVWSMLLVVYQLIKGDITNIYTSLNYTLLTKEILNKDFKYEEDCSLLERTICNLMMCRERPSAEECYNIFRKIQ